MGFPENFVTVGFVPDKFRFVVETSGALSPEDILDFALTAILEKLRLSLDSVRAVA